MADEREAAAACYKISSIIMMMKLCPVDKQKGFKGMGKGNGEWVKGNLCSLLLMLLIQFDFCALKSDRILCISRGKVV